MNYQNITDYEKNIIISEEPQDVISEHTHASFEAVYVLSGACSCQINRSAEEMLAGDLCILPPFARHSIHRDDGCRLISIIIYPAVIMDISPGILSGQDLLGNFFLKSVYQNNTESYLLFHTGQEENVRSTILKMLDEMTDTDEYTDRIVSGMLLTLFMRLLRTHRGIIKSSLENNRIDEILSMIYNHYNTITLSSLAEHLHYTVPYCSKYLKQHLGCTFSHLIKQIRFHKAENMLTDSGMTVTHISKELGYENLENFVRAFKQQYQMTPSQYRLSRSPQLPPPG